MKPQRVRSTQTSRRSPWGTRNGIAAVLFTVLIAASTRLTLASAPTDPQRGDAAPSVEFTTLDGKHLSTDDLLGSVQILLFVRTDQDLSNQAFRRIHSVLQSPDLRGHDIRWLTIFSKSSDPNLEATFSSAIPNPPPMVHDSTRAIFGSYSIIAIPTVIVINPTNHYTHFMPGFSPRFDDILKSAVRLAEGDLTPGQFDQLLTPHEQTKSPARIKAERHVNLARHAQKRGMHDLALNEYLNAQKADPDWPVPTLAAGYLYLRTGKLDQARTQFQSLLDDAVHTSDQAALGLALALARDGDESLNQAEAIALGIIKRSPNSPRAHYVLGVVFEKRKQLERAAEQYRRSAQLLLDAADPDLAVSP